MPRDPKTKLPGWLVHPRTRVVGFVVLILAAYVAPRAVALRGVELTSPFSFGDMNLHLTNVYLMHSLNALPVTFSDPVFEHFPSTVQLLNRERWQHGTYHVSYPFVAAFGPLSIWTTQLTNFLFSAVLVLGVFLLGRQLGGRREGTRIGLWGALLTVLHPALVASTWYYSLDYPLMGMIIVGLALLLATRGFTDWPWSLAFGLWSGVALYIKFTYALYLVIPCLAALAFGRRSGGVTARSRVALATAKGLGSAALLTLGLSLLLQRWSPAEVWDQVAMHFTGDTTGGALELPLLEPWTLRWAGAMLRFAVQRFPWPLLLLALPGLALLHWPRRAVRHRWLPLAFFWGTYVVLTLMANKMERYLQPVYPLLCLLTAWWIVTVLPRRWRTAALALAALAYGALLWTIHADPQAFTIDDEHITEDRYMYEVGMPGRRDLDGLRERVYHPTHDLRLLVDRARELVRQDHTTEPIGVVVLRRRPAVRDAAPGLDGALALALAHRVRDRFFAIRELTLSWPPLKEMPKLLLFHPPDLELAPLIPNHRVVACRRARVRYASGWGSNGDGHEGVVTIKVCMLRLLDSRRSRAAPRW